jgi:hypothetical protein
MEKFFLTYYDNQLTGFEYGMKTENQSIKRLFNAFHISKVQSLIQVFIICINIFFY